MLPLRTPAPRVLLPGRHHQKPRGPPKPQLCSGGCNEPASGSAAAASPRLPSSGPHSPVPSVTPPQARELPQQHPRTTTQGRRGASAGLSPTFETPGPLDMSKHSERSQKNNRGLLFKTLFFNIPGGLTARLQAREARGQETSHPFPVGPSAAPPTAHPPAPLPTLPHRPQPAQPHSPWMLSPAPLPTLPHRPGLTAALTLDAQHLAQLERRPAHLAQRPHDALRVGL